jgi:hypothetical protein
MKRILLLVLTIGSLTMALGMDSSPGDVFRVVISMPEQVFHHDEDIFVTMTVTNQSGHSNSFTIYDERERDVSYTTFQPVVYDSMGRNAEIIVPYRQKDIELDDLLSSCTTRTILLGPGESFSYRTDLRKIYRLRAETSYRVRGFFFPDLSERVSIRSMNGLSFSIKRREYHTYRSGILDDYRPEKYSREVSPAEIVTLALNAEKENDWERLRKYINIEKYIRSYSKFLSEYSDADIIEKAHIRKRFVRYLARKRHDRLVSYKILDQRVKRDRAQVEVYVVRYGVRKNEQFTYYYTLQKPEEDTDGHWLITDLEATVVKGMPQ